MDPTPEPEILTLANTRLQRGTRMIFGKPYHYGIKGGELTLLPGPDPRTTEFHMDDIADDTVEVSVNGQTGQMLAVRRHHEETP